MLSRNRKQEIQDAEQIIGKIESLFEDAGVKSVALQKGDFTYQGLVAKEVRFYSDLEVVCIDDIIEYNELDTIGIDNLQLLLEAVKKRLH